MFQIYISLWLLIATLTNISHYLYSLFRHFLSKKRNYSLKNILSFVNFVPHFYARWDYFKGRNFHKNRKNPENVPVKSSIFQSLPEWNFLNLIFTREMPRHLFEINIFNDPLNLIISLFFLSFFLREKCHVIYFKFNIFNDLP